MPVEDLVDGWAEMQDALPAYQEAEDYYEGDVEEVFANPRIEAAIASTGERYKFALAAVPVDVLADRVQLVGVQAGNARADEAIAAVVKANRLQVNWTELIRMTFEYGDAYLMAWPVNPDSSGTGVVSQQLAAAGVEVTLQNPKHCRVFYDEESERSKTFAIKRWQVKTPLGKAWRADVYYPGIVERWQSRAGENPDTKDAWKPFVDATVSEGDTSDGSQIPTPTDEIPFIHFRTALPYGRPIHRRAYGCQNAITKMLVTQINTTDSHGWPQRYALAEAGAELDNASDDPDWEDDDDAADSGSIQGGVPSSGRVGPGTIQQFTGTREVGQFASADPRVFLDPTQLYVRLMAQLTHTPLHYFDPTGDAPSGESLQVAERPVVSHADRMVLMLTDPVQEFWDYALRLAGAPVGQVVDVKWKPTKTAIGASDWEAARAQQDAGVPIPETLVEAGYERDLVESWGLPEHPADFAAPSPVIGGAGG